ncbi:hypothetical protein C8J57DRAFT_1522004 [Mycena rebaudengoi]|nr:hypothetical protein C8J57DRAFT_1522004 [Mycena rebaudengoi]
MLETDGPYVLARFVRATRDSAEPSTRPGVCECPRPRASRQPSSACVRNAWDAMFHRREIAGLVIHVARSTPTCVTARRALQQRAEESHGVSTFIRIIPVMDVRGADTRYGADIHATLTPLLALTRISRFPRAAANELRPCFCTARDAAFLRSALRPPHVAAPKTGQMRHAPSAVPPHRSADSPAQHSLGASRFHHLARPSTQRAHRYPIPTMSVSTRRHGRHAAAAAPATRRRGSTSPARPSTPTLPYPTATTHPSRELIRSVSRPPTHRHTVANEVLLGPPGHLPASTPRSSAIHILAHITAHCTFHRTCRHNAVPARLPLDKLSPLRSSAIRIAPATVSPPPLQFPVPVGFLLWWLHNRPAELKTHESTSGVRREMLGLAVRDTRRRISRFN